MALLGATSARTLRGRLLLSHSIAVVGVLLVLGVVLDRVLERAFVDQLTESLVTDARAVQEAVPTGSDLEPSVRRLGRAMDVRITVIRSDGVVLADSQHDPATMENHRSRSEVKAAIRGRIGIASRESRTVGVPFRYVALPPAGGRIVRVALPLTTVRSKVDQLRAMLAIGFGFAGLVGIFVLGAIARSVSRPLRDIATSVERFGESGEAPLLPERGTAEVAVLARTFNRLRAELAARMDAMARDRATRDAILSSLQEGVLLISPDGEVAYGNESAVRLLGRRIGHARALPDWLRPIVDRAHSATERNESEPGVVLDREIVADAVGLPDDGGVVVVLRDVTEARRLDAVRRDFAANASHELKTPVASIRALAETIATAQQDDSDRVGAFASQLEDEAERLSRVISDLLDLSRLEGKAPPRTLVRLDDVVHEELTRIADRAAASGVTVDIRPLGALNVNGSRGDLSLMVRNLLENAVEYSREGDEVVVEAERRDGQVVLAVRDTGIGIPAKDRSRVFERFYRVDRARSRATGGTGLGLSIVKHVADSHGGSVDVETQLGAGSTFTVTLPLATEA